MKCLLVVDLQKGFISLDAKHIVPLIEELIPYFKKDAIIASKYVNDDEYREKWSNFHEVKDKPDTDLLLNLESIANLVVEKSTYTAITDEVKLFLKEKNIKEVYLVGIATDCCVLKSALDLFDMDIRPIVLTSYCAASKVEYHNQGIDILKRLIGEEQVKEGVIENG